MSKSSAIDQFKSWLTPALLVLIGYLAKNKMDSMDAKLDLIMPLQTQQAINTTTISRLDNDLGNLTDRFNQHLSAIPEGEITIKRKSGK